MFHPLQVEVMDRFTRVEMFFRASRRLDPSQRVVAKGFAFVDTYAVYEFTVSNVMRVALEAIMGHGHKYNELRPSMLALFLDPDLRSLRDCGHSAVWDRRVALLKHAFSDDAAIVANNVLPVDGSHFRHTQLEVIFEVLGIERMPARRRRHLYRVDEVVNHRNAIAHGRERAEAIGGRFSRNEVWRMIRQMKSVCLCVLSAVEEHCAHGARHRR